MPRIKTATLEGDLDDRAGNTETEVNTGQPHANTKAYYTRRIGSNAYDKLEFRFHLTAGGGPFEYVYAVATFGLTPVDDGNNTLESRDTETSIYPPNPSAVRDKVGNGRHIKIDPTLPGLDVVLGITIQIGDADDPITTDAEADDVAITTAGAVVGIDSTLKISASMADFGEHTLQFVVIGRDGKSFG